MGSGAAPAGLDAAAAPQKVALVVGLNRYTPEAGLHDLRFAAADAEAVGDVLEENGYRVHRLLDTATQAAFDAALNDATASLQRDDLFLLYFAGHAQLEPGGDAHDLHLLFSDDRGDRGDGLSIDDLGVQVRALPATRRVVVLDTCYSEQTQQWIARLRGGPPPVTAPSVGQFDAWIFSAAPQQSAQEDPALGHGVFTYFLLDALRGEADQNNDGIVGVLEVYNWVGYATAEHTGRAQVPRIEESRIGWEDLPLVQREATERGSAAVAWYENILPGAQLLVDGLTRGPGAVDPGVHAVEMRDAAGETVLKRRVTLREGEYLDWEPLIASTQSQVRVGVGVGWTPVSARVPPVAVGIHGWATPSAPGGLRPAFGATLAASRGDVGGGQPGTFASGTVRGAALWRGRSRLGFGPFAGAGLAWQLDRAPIGTAPLLESGLHLQVDLGRAWLGMDGGLRAWPAQGEGWSLYPALQTVAGVRF